MDIFSDMNVTANVRSRLKKIPRGKPFTSRLFSELGSSAAIAQALSRMVKNGEIERVSQAIFVRLEMSQYVGKVLPEPFKVAKAIAAKGGAKVQINGAEAARRLGLTTQVPVRLIFWTNGPPRRFRVGRLEAVMKPVSTKKLALAGRPAGTALAALWYLGKRATNETTLGQIEKELAPKEFEALEREASSSSPWMAEAFHKYHQAAEQ